MCTSDYLEENVLIAERRYEACQLTKPTSTFYSPKAYNFLRKKITLPHSSQIRKWLASKKCDVGFLTEVFSFLNSSVKENDYVQNDYMQNVP